jgi:hypothetical protein
MDLAALRAELARILTEGTAGGTPCKVSPYGVDVVEPPTGGVHVMIEASPDQYIEYAVTFSRSGQAVVRFHLAVFASITAGAESGQEILDRFLSTTTNESLWVSNWQVGDHTYVLDGATSVGERRAVDSSARFTVAEIPVRVTVSKGT